MISVSGKNEHFYKKFQWFNYIQCESMSCDSKGSVLHLQIHLAILMFLISFQKNSECIWDNEKNLSHQLDINSSSGRHEVVSRKSDHIEKNLWDILIQDTKISQNPLRTLKRFLGRCPVLWWIEFQVQFIQHTVQT